MLRKLLACLALLTGLAAAGAPAQAEVANALAAQLEVSASVPAAIGGSVVAVRSKLPRRPAAVAVAAPVARMERRALRPAVQLGSDRARE